jgi:hypothetical protein
VNIGNTIDVNITNSAITVTGTVNINSTIDVNVSNSTINVVVQNFYSTSGQVQNFDVQVGTTASAITTDTSLIQAVIMLADPYNPSEIFVGNATNQLFPLVAGASLTLNNVVPANIYVVSNQTGNTLHVIYSGG